MQKKKTTSRSRALTRHHHVRRLVDTTPPWATQCLVSIRITPMHTITLIPYQTTRGHVKMQCVLNAPLPSWCLFSTYQQDLAVEEPPSTRRTRHVESVEAEERAQRHGPREQQEKNAPGKPAVQRAPYKAGGKKKYEPCPRWRSLRRSSSNGYLTSLLVK